MHKKRFTLKYLSDIHLKEKEMEGKISFLYIVITKAN